MRKILKVKGLKGYCCPMDSGPLGKYIRRNKKRVRRLLKNLTRKEVGEYL